MNNVAVITGQDGAYLAQAPVRRVIFGEGI